MDYGALIQELGGEYIDQDYFTSKCTHLVVGKTLFVHGVLIVIASSSFGVQNFITMKVCFLFTSL